MGKMGKRIAIVIAVENYSDKNYKMNKRRAQIGTNERRLRN
jgi:hypothetical protein